MHGPADAPQFLVTLEHSAFAQAIRESVWAYPIANVGHILALTLFAACVVIMDLRILGAFSATAPAAIVVPARRMAMLGLGLMAITGFLLFAPEASRVGMNRVFQIKAALIGLGILNALLVAGPALSNIVNVPAHASLPAPARMAALMSMLIWLSVAACGRLIAYF
jgi:hypothetical protein